MCKLNLMIKTTAAVICAIGVAGLMSINVLAASGTVNASNVNVRSSADTSANSVAVLNTNDTVTIVTEVTGQDGKIWYNVTTASGATGFIRSDLVTKSADTTTPAATTTPATTDPNAAATTTTNNAAATTTTNNTTTTTTTTTTATTTPQVQVTAIDNQTAYIAPASVNIRKTPSTNGDIVAKAQQNSVITLTGETQSSDNYKWYQVSFEANGSTMTGFIRSDLITFTAPTVKPEQTEITGQQGAQEEEEPEETPVEEPVAEEPVEEPVAEDPVEEPAPAANNGISSLHAVQPGAAPSVIPTGFEEVEVKFGNDTVTAYAKGDYYLIYAENGDNNPMWYIFDYRTSNFIQYDGLLSSADVKSGMGSLNIVIIAVAAVIILVLIIFIVLLLLRRGKGNNYDYDDYDTYEEDEKYTKPSASSKKTIYAKDSVEDILDDDDDLYETDDIVSKSYAPEPKQTYVEDEVYSDSYEEEEYDEEEEEEYVKPAKKAPAKKAKKEKPAKKAGKKSFGAKFLDYFTEVEEVDDGEDDDDDDYEEEEYVKPAAKSSSRTSYIPDDDEDDINFIDL